MYFRRFFSKFTFRSSISGNIEYFDLSTQDGLVWSINPLV